MSTLQGGVPRNRLLAALPAETYAALQPELEAISLEQKQSLYEPHQPIEHVYFVENGVVSLLSVMDDGTAVEISTVGNEGMIGIPVFLGTDRTPGLAFTQIPGDAARLHSEVFRQIVEREKEFQQLLQRYTQYLFLQLSQSVACNRIHPVEQRCCRWLLMTHDRVDADTFPLTQEFLAQMLGVRRASVNEVERALQEAGLITYRRGQVTVVNRQGLEETSCECYRIVRAEYQRLLGNAQR
jgi:CRP-like cAMP-binding protein